MSAKPKATSTSLVKAPTATPAVVEVVEPGERLLQTFFRMKYGKTLEAYQQDLEDFATFCGCPGPGAALTMLTSHGPGKAIELVIRYREDMLQRPIYRSQASRDAGEEPTRFGYAPSTINRRIAALRSACHIAKSLEIITWDLVVDWERVTPYRDTTGISQEDRKVLFDHLRAKVKAAKTEHAKLMALRNYALVRTLYDHALRREEALLLRLSDVDFNAKPPRLWILGKGKQRHNSQRESFPLSKLSQRALAAYIDMRGDHDGPLFESGHRGHRRARLHKGSLNNLLEKWAMDAGIEHVWPHAFRHSAITSASDKTNGNIPKVQQYSRHRTLDVVVRYVDHAQEAARQIVELVAEDDEEDDDIDAPVPAPAGKKRSRRVAKR